MCSIAALAAQPCLHLVVVSTGINDCLIVCTASDSMPLLQAAPCLRPGLPAAPTTPLSAWCHVSLLRCLFCASICQQDAGWVGVG